MLDEHVEYYHAIARRITSDPPFAHELTVRWAYRNRIHTKIASRLQQVARLPHFSGTLSSGQHTGRVLPWSLDVPLPSWATYSASTDTNETESKEETEGSGDAATGEHVGADEEELLRVESLSTQESDALVSFMDNLGDRELLQHDV